MRRIAADTPNALAEGKVDNRPLASGGSLGSLNGEDPPYEGVLSAVELCLAAIGR